MMNYIAPSKARTLIVVYSFGFKGMKLKNIYVCVGSGAMEPVRACGWIGDCSAAATMASAVSIIRPLVSPSKTICCLAFLSTGFSTEQYCMLRVPELENPPGPDFFLRKGVPVFGSQSGSLGYALPPFPWSPPSLVASVGRRVPWIWAGLVPSSGGWPDPIRSSICIISILSPLGRCDLAAALGLERLVWLGEVLGEGAVILVEARVRLTITVTVGLLEHVGEREICEDLPQLNPVEGIKKKRGRPPLHKRAGVSPKQILGPGSRKRKANQVNKSPDTRRSATPQKKKKAKANNNLLTSLNQSVGSNIGSTRRAQPPIFLIPAITGPGVIQTGHSPQQTANLRESPT
ncbi:unnamed protein product [Arabis nemorensis]|uniref:Uncharacterized protein n=1 Tax=Arabis nemorensis TaxID=586526 RepID=A0A565BCI9_9BRAS|nr:unnamed protein product [Arabis nemorensis]